MHADTMGRIVDLNEQVRGTLPLVNKDCDFLKDEHSLLLGELGLASSHTHTHN